ncbi:MAG: nucleotidyltransferase domain-containing protein [Candidatus Scalindua rubra]|uniref:Polymerase nucleotidyl transferase domain-containing protein n=1 Tax=Candidatus Scalindua brodae TaxID=237368 RepID=A0A0B0ERI1_9BACT|nr:MAG: hypothetical protein SCABRO_00486 [Candidatus Scalindua brodae]MBZ0107046.1 nucleotidyltransferase domain-containing protein [Candidatus Scalindua rubra]
MGNNEITHNDLIEFIKTNKRYLCSKFHLVKIGVFGSFARNEQTVDSDIDLIVELEENTQNIYEIKTELRNYFKKHLNKDIDIAREKYLKPRVKAEILRDVQYV